MNIPKDITITGAALLAGFLSLTPAIAADAPPEKAQVLLDQVKKSELNRALRPANLHRPAEGRLGQELKGRGSPPADH